MKQEQQAAVENNDGLKSKLVSRSKSVATSYHYRFHHFGWAIWTINDATGELTLQSDWGNWSHRWNILHLGAPSLTAFITRKTDTHYLANKLGVEHKVDDEHETRKNVKRAIVVARREHRVASEEARSAFEEVRSIDLSGDGLLNLSDETQKILGVENDPASLFGEYQGRVVSHSWTIVTELLKLLIADLREGAFDVRAVPDAPVVGS